MNKNQVWLDPVRPAGIKQTSYFRVSPAQTSLICFKKYITLNSGRSAFCDPSTSRTTLIFGFVLN